MSASQIGSSGEIRAKVAKSHRWQKLVVATTLLIAVGWAYVHSHPLVFMETHAFCIKCAGLELSAYADQHQGRFPSHPKGYPHALLLLNEDCFNCLTGPGYDAAPLFEAKRTGRDLTEAECGRVYIQGLTTKSNPEIALLFDKLPTPGGDHCHLPVRLWAPLGREVSLVSSLTEFIPETAWPEFARKQVELLVQDGVNRKEAERLFATSFKEGG
jgi:hypothetical protein